MSAVGSSLSIIELDFVIGTVVKPVLEYFDCKLPLMACTQYI